jgi:hypothetical protein
MPNTTTAQDSPPSMTAAEFLTTVAAYVKACGSTDALAPMNGAPFVQKGRIYLQLEGRGGAGREAAEFTATGLRPWILAEKGDAPGKGALKSLLDETGFVRKPFSYHHPERGSSSASYYSREVDGFDGLDAPEARERPARESRRTERNPVRDVLSERIVPQMPEGNEEDTKRLQELWDAYNAARKTFQQIAARKTKTDGVSKPVLERKRAEKAEQLQAAREASHAAHEELLLHRRHMDSLNLATAEKAAS